MAPLHATEHTHLGLHKNEHLLNEPTAHHAPLLKEDPSLGMMHHHHNKDELLLNNNKSSMLAPGNLMEEPSPMTSTTIKLKTQVKPAECLTERDKLIMKAEEGKRDAMWMATRTEDWKNLFSEPEWKLKREQVDRKLNNFLICRPSHQDLLNRGLLWKDITTAKDHDHLWELRKKELTSTMTKFLKNRPKQEALINKGILGTTDTSSLLMPTSSSASKSSSFDVTSSHSSEKKKRISSDPKMDSTHPSKTTGVLHELVGGIKEGVGKVIGSEKMAKEGQELKHTGKMELHEAKALNRQKALEEKREGALKEQEGKRLGDAELEREGRLERLKGERRLAHNK
ncbi:hypothetical protein QOT17_019179 [Balamuthia mandrillaris]